MFSISDLSLKPTGVSLYFWQWAKVGKPLPNAGASPRHCFQLFFDFVQADLLDGVQQAGHFGDALLPTKSVQFGAGEVDLTGRNRVYGAARVGVERGVGAATAGEQ